MGGDRERQRVLGWEVDCTWMGCRRQGVVFPGGFVGHEVRSCHPRGVRGEPGSPRPSARPAPC